MGVRTSGGAMGVALIRFAGRLRTISYGGMSFVQTNVSLSAMGVALIRFAGRLRTISYGGMSFVQTNVSLSRRNKRWSRLLGVEGRHEAAGSVVNLRCSAVNGRTSFRTTDVRGRRMGDPHGSPQTTW